jgi:UDP-glucuronate 4-epimerase
MPAPRTALITGGAGFIGSHVTDRLLASGWSVTAVDNFDPFYDANIKWRNIEAHLNNPQYTLLNADVRDLQGLRTRLPGGWDVIVHLAAKAGVRPSIADPGAYQEVNVLGTQNMLELAKIWGVEQFVFASSSSVYGINPDVPWREDNPVLLPISPYAGTKVSGELLGHVYSHLYGMRFIALRFFTVYGPRQRPDLAIHKLARMLLNGEPLPIYGDGGARRDYTYVDDIVTGVVAAMNYDRSRYEVINLGGSRTVSLLEMVRSMERVAGCHARLKFLPEQPGDVPATYADTAKAKALLGFQPSLDFEAGLERFFAWLYPQMRQLAKALHA